MISFYKKKPDDIYIDPYEFKNTWDNAKDNELICKKLYDVYLSNKVVNTKRHYADCKICGENKEAVFTDPNNFSEKRLTACDILLKKSEHSNYIIPSIVLHIIQKHNLKPNNETLIELLKNFNPLERESP